MEKSIGTDIGVDSDGGTFHIMFGIAVGDHHNASSGPWIDVERNFIERATARSIEKTDEVGIDTKEDALGLRVAHTSIIFDNEWVAVTVHEAKEDEALVVDILAAEALDGRTDDAVLDLAHKGSVGKRERANGAHTARIEAGVALADTLIVFGLGEDEIMGTIGKDEDAEFDASEVLFDNDTRRSLAKLSIGEHSAELGLGVGKVVEDEDTFASGKAIGLEDVWRLQGGKEGDAFIDSVASESAILSGRNSMAGHKSLGEILAAFE